MSPSSAPLNMATTDPLLDLHPCCALRVHISLPGSTTRQKMASLGSVFSYRLHPTGSLMSIHPTARVHVTVSSPTSKGG